jgi:hypothetical protein
MVGNEIYIQRGETFSLDFEVVTKKGHPYMLLKTWQNPYLVITVSAALYEQAGDYRESSWLDLNERWVEKDDGSIVLEPTKKFISTEPLFVNSFDVAEIISTYKKIVFDKQSDFDITNYLFYTDGNLDGNYVYKYVDNYSVVDGEYNVTWKDYSFRIVKTFDTKSWMEQGYLYDAKILTGESLRDVISSQLEREEIITSAGTWSDSLTQSYIDMIDDEEIRAEAQYLFDEGIPLRSTYDTKLLIIEPSRLYVSVNIQGGVG